MSSDSLWAITSYFNPAAYRRRLETYRVFRQRLTVPLATVELSFDGRFELRPGDADALVQIHGGDVMWQKERLLNLAARLLPGSCDAVAWLDCDVVFTREDWATQASRALHDVPLVHLYQARADLPRDASPDRLPADLADTAAPSMVYKLMVEHVPAEDLLVPHPRQKRLASQGLAWATRRDVLDRHGLYDVCILGSGDRAMMCAAMGTFDYGIRALLMNDRQQAHYLAWARPYHDSIQGRIGYIPGLALHLWHGEVRDRQYGLREQGFAAFGFDPFTDIALDEHGCWRWSSDKPAFHDFVRRYFASRNEDGA